ncbi:MAG: hypothetical protein JOZ18_10565 [Chloroflexi bacterium]|nr:hypothetical protein [Chloroflexota bacterium]
MSDRSFRLFNPSTLFNWRKYIAPFRSPHTILKVLTYLFPLFVSVRWLTSRSFGSYEIKKEILSSAMPIIFTRSETTRLSICLKLWKRYDDFCNIKDKDAYIDHLLDGLKFNKVFAPGVYLGIAPIVIDENLKESKKLSRGWLIKKYPKKEDILNTDVKEYVLVMRELDEKWRLDDQLKDKLDTRLGMEFLASEIVRMHKKVIAMHKKRKKVPGSIGTGQDILSKLYSNIDLFNEALDHLAKYYPDVERDVERHRSLADFMKRAGEACKAFFDARFKNGHIKRCHGDLKLTNLWLLEKPLNFGYWSFSKRLFALDCVDFNREFCHIDTLSDIAMLAIDIEMHLAHHLDAEQTEQLTQHFLSYYLSKSEKNREMASLLLAYYMTEKAMVRASMCALYDGQMESGKEYLAVAHRHANELEKLLMVQKAASFSSREMTTSRCST